LFDYFKRLSKQVNKI